MNDIEEKFFKTFEIKPCKRGFTLKDCTDRDCTECGHFTANITDRILLELICIIVKTMTSYAINKSNIKDIKEEVLIRCINLKSFIYHQVQSLFREGEE